MYSTPPWVSEGYSQGLTVFWKRDRLQELIDLNHDLIQMNLWPTKADHFAMRVSHTTVVFDKAPDLFRFIAYCFGDFYHPFFEDHKDWEYELKGF